MLQVQEIELEKLHPWEDNPRINDHAVTAVSQSISSFGFKVPILCDQCLTIIAGHTRWKAAKQLGLDTVPVIVVEMSDTQCRAFAVADNKTAEIADWDFPKLREILEELRLEAIDINSLGFSNQELRRFVFTEDNDENIVPETDNRAVDLPPLAIPWFRSEPLSV
jgi:ParB family chromosome partitioning protein